MKDIYSSVYNLGLRLADVMAIAGVTAAYTVPSYRYVVVSYDLASKRLDFRFCAATEVHSPAFESLFRPGIVYVCTDRQLTAVELADKLEAAVARLED